MTLTSHNNNVPNRPRPGSTTTELPIDANQDGSRLATKLATGRPNKSTTRSNRNLKQPESIITVGTCNVRTLIRCAKLEEFTK